MLRFETVRRGTLHVVVDGTDYCFDVRVVCGTERYHVVSGLSLGPACDSLEAACAGAEPSAEQKGEHSARVEWDRAVSAEPDEKACFVCGAGLGEAREPNGRYPERLCAPCVLEAVDEQGRELTFSNESFGGGFAAVQLATGEKTAQHVCFVRGTKCWADEAHFGGIVVIPHRT
jgi:hypothetical protein